MFVVGIDPGLSRCGFGAVRRTRNVNTAVEFGVMSSPPELAHPLRLAKLAGDLRELLDRLRPDVVVVERVFFQTNARTAIGVAQASGLAIAAAIAAGCEVVEYTSNEVKLAIAGYGGADKAQMQRMVAKILGLSELPKPADAADALALAVHHLAVAPFLARQRSASLQSAIARADSGAPTSPLGNARIATSVGAARLTQVSPSSPFAPPPPSPRRSLRKDAS